MLSESQGTSRSAEAGASMWAQFASASDLGAFCDAWLRLQCAALSGTGCEPVTAVVIWQHASAAYGPVAVWPQPRSDASHLGATARRALTERRGVLERTPAGEAGPAAASAGAAGASGVGASSLGTVLAAQAAYPAIVDGHAHGVAVVELRAPTEAALQRALQQLHWGAGWLESRARGLAGQAQVQLAARGTEVLDLLAVLAEQEGVQPAALALANELAVRLGAARVLVGFERRGHVRVEAISNVAWFDRRGQDVARIENAMEEALDQGATVAVPRPEHLPFRVAVAHDEQRAAAALGAIATVLLVGRQRPVGALTVEWRSGGEPPAEAAAPGAMRPAKGQPDRPSAGAASGALPLSGAAVPPTQALAPPAAAAVPSPREALARALPILESLALIVGPVVEDRLERRRWFSGRIADGARGLHRRLRERGHASLKLGLLTAAALVAVLAVARMDYRVTAKAAIEGVVQRAAVAPFRGFVATAPVRAGDRVRAGQVMATLDDRDLLLEQVRYRSEAQQAEEKVRDATARRDRSAAVQAAAQQRQAQAQLDLAEEKLARARITAPLDGLVVSGDLSQLLGSPVEPGQTLFEVAPLDAYRVVLRVDERDITELQVGQRGQLVLTGVSREPMPFTVRNITAVAEASEGQNLFRVEAALDAALPFLRPGMEGVGKVEVGRRGLLWVWTHPFTDWLRLAAWRWLP